MLIVHLTNILPLVVPERILTLSEYPDKAPRVTGFRRSLVSAVVRAGDSV